MITTIKSSVQRRSDSSWRDAAGSLQANFPPVLVIALGRNGAYADNI